MKVPYVHSNFARVEGDYYPTIDKRCVYGFLQYFPKPGLCIDPCAPDGSGIVDTLKECGIYAEGRTDYTQVNACFNWIVCNPPYKRGLVDEIIHAGIDSLSKGIVDGAAYLLRSNFAFAKSRVDMFRDNPLYYGEIKLLFRPWWSEDRTAQPIHNYVWHIWMQHEFRLPVVFYADGE